jgi:hypothetical protein
MRTNAFMLKPALQAAIRLHCVGWITVAKLTSRHPPLHSESSITNATPIVPANKRPPTLPF